METWNRMRTIGGEQEGVEWWKDGEGFSQRTCMNDSWIWTTERGLTVGERVGLHGVGKGKITGITNKINKNKLFKYI